MSTNDEKIDALAASLRGAWNYIRTGQRAYQGDPGWVIPCGFCGMLHLRPPPPECCGPGDEGIRTPRAEPLREQGDVMAKREARDSYTLNRTSVALGDAHNALCRYVDKIRRRVEELEKWATNSQETVNESDCVVSQEQPKSGGPDNNLVSPLRQTFWRAWSNDYGHNTCDSCHNKIVEGMIGPCPGTGKQTHLCFSCWGQFKAVGVPPRVEVGP